MDAIESAVEVWDGAAHVDATKWSPRLAWPSVSLGEAIGLSAAAIFVSLYTNEWLAGAALFVLGGGYKLLVFPGSTPVLFLAFAFQWAQVSIGIFYYGFTGRSLATITGSDYRTMVGLGLITVSVLAGGLRTGVQLVWRNRRSDEAWPEEAISWPVLIGAYVATLSSETVVRNFAWDNPSITQAVLAFDMVRLGVLFLLLRRLTRPQIRWGAIILVLTIETGSGLIGFFAGFREPLILAILAVLEVFDRRKTEHRVALGLFVAAGAILGLLWIGIRTDYRRDFTELDTYQTTSTRRVTAVQDLAGAWWHRDTEDLLTDVDFFIERMWAIYYPALAVSRVPQSVPHTNGALLWAVIQHITMPRVFFPDKAKLPSNSDLVRQYAGIWVAGEEEGTSIAFGYAAESYVDFGAPLMFLPMIVFFTFMGAAYAWLMNSVHHRELAVGLTTVVFWMSLYLFERSWAKMVGDALTMLIYLGTATLIVDRILLTRVKSKSQ